MTQPGKPDYIAFPCPLLDKIPSALHRGIFVCLLEKADENGQLVISIRGFANEMGVSYQNLRTAISKLSANAIINAIPTHQLTLITICKFDTYGISYRKSQRKSNVSANAITTQSKPTKFTPPTEEEVAAYCQEKGYHFNPGQFVPHYQSKGWKVGNQPMKDWRAACRTWEVSWKERYGERFYYDIRPVASPDSAATRREGRDRLRVLATGVLSQSADKLLSLYNGSGQDPDHSRD